MAKRTFDYVQAALAYENLKSCRLVGEEFGVTEGAIRRALKRVGVHRLGKGRRRYDHGAIGRDYAAGMTPSQIHGRYGIALSYVTHLIRQSGARVRRERSELSLPESPAQLGYLAGLVDGEGSIYVRPHEVRVCIVNTDKDLIDWLATLGGKVLARHHSRLGTKPIWIWQVNRRADAMALLNALLPYLRVKHDAAASARARLR